MVVSHQQQGYIKRTPLSTYRAQHRGGKGLTGAKTEEEDPIEHLFVASTHAYLLFFTNQGKVYWQKVYDLPQLGRDSRGRAVVNLLNLQEGEEQMADAGRSATSPTDHFLIMATRSGLVKKTALAAYSRPMKGGIIAIKLREGDELVDVVSVTSRRRTRAGHAQRHGHPLQAVRRPPDGPHTSGVKGIRLSEQDAVVGMVVADPETTLLTVCAKGYGKRTPFGQAVADDTEGDAANGDEAALDAEGAAEPEDKTAEAPASEAEPAEGEEGEDAAAGYSGNQRYRRQRRGGKGLRDIRTTDRNGKVVDIVSVTDDDEVIMITARGKIQRVRAADISQIGRNTQGVRIIRLDEGDTLVSLARIPAKISE